MATEGVGTQAGRSLAKDFHHLMKTIASMSGGQARVVNWDEENLEQPITVAVIPDSGPYKHGEFEFSMTCGYTDYPNVPLDHVHCDTHIFHPNIDGDGDICLNIFRDREWSSSMNLEDVVQGILFLMHNPNLDDPLIPTFPTDNFVDNVRRSLDGETVEGIDFKRNRVRRGENGKVIREDGPEVVVCLEGQPQQETAGDRESEGAAAGNKTTEQRQKLEAKNGLVEDGERRVTVVS